MDLLEWYSNIIDRKLSYFRQKLVIVLSTLFSTVLSQNLLTICMHLIHIQNKIGSIRPKQTHHR